MLFHRAHVLAEQDDYVRADVDNVPPVPVLQVLQDRLASGRPLQGGVSVDAPSSSPDAVLYGRVLDYTKYGAMIAVLELRDAAPPRRTRVAAGCLYLSGKVRTKDQEYAKLFQTRCRPFASEWKLPQPPLEMDPRPLFVYVFFNVGGDGGPGGAQELLAQADGFGLGFLAQVRAGV